MSKRAQVQRFRIKNAKKILYMKVNTVPGGIFIKDLFHRMNFTIFLIADM